MAKHHPDLIFCRKQPGVGKNNSCFSLCNYNLKYYNCFQITRKNYLIIDKLFLILFYLYSHRKTL